MLKKSRFIGTFLLILLIASPVQAKKIKRFTGDPAFEITPTATDDNQMVKPKTQALPKQSRENFEAGKEVKNKLRKNYLSKRSKLYQKYHKDTEDTSTQYNQERKKSVENINHEL